MPAYEYHCASCGNAFELWRPMSESSAPATCPTCGGAAEKLVSVFASTSGYGIKVPERPAFRGGTEAS